ncbi:hypothetical protein SAMN02745664_11450 [Moraxella cuniculi DSM 21768]|uniref:Uncharacterized protein n=1 Tax=Moraxella cuniculi DSM 21768 TaxID=1122245 RepID=A0A1N7FMP4_9GAMM|nr:hypothetical protein [Moraxella cuniculi]OOS05703.1 hypothetical protein B0189_06130 [Moraxella cuniculi]SIS01560.1 hypothetical protein SAMN02745664_11450 [Moraxella cuniculi DSM 21768]
MLTFPIFIYQKIDYYFLNPVNQDKMPDSFPKLRDKIQADMNHLTQGLPKPVYEWSYYKPTVNLISEFRRFPYNDAYLSIILDNIPKNKNLQNLPDEDSNTILSYCDYNVYTKIGKERIDKDENEFIYIQVDFEDRGVCMY